MTDRAIQATFSDWGTVKSRKILQLVFEIPLEQQAEALTMLGAPMPDRETWCAIALLQNPGTVRESRRPDESASPPASPTPPAGAIYTREERERAMRASVMLVRDPAFQAWAARKCGLDPSEDVAISVVRAECAIASRSEIALSERAYEAFQRLRTTYEIETGKRAEPR